MMMVVKKEGIRNILALDKSLDSFWGQSINVLQFNNRWWWFSG